MNAACITIIFTATQMSRSVCCMRRIDLHSVPLIIAHRGASADAPENTLDAFRLAITQGADGVECDLRLSADSAIVLSHDDSLWRTHDDPRAIADVTAADLFEYRIPTLSSMLAVVWGAVPLINLELKEAVPPDLLAETIGSRTGSIVLSSFSADILATLRDDLPDIPRWFLAHRGTEATLHEARELGCAALHVWHRTTTPRFIAHASRAGFPVYVWTLDDPRRAIVLAGRGVAGITTNTPGKLRAVFAPNTAKTQGN